MSMRRMPSYSVGLSGPPCGALATRRGAVPASSRAAGSMLPGGVAEPAAPPSSRVVSPLASGTVSPSCRLLLAAEGERDESELDWSDPLDEADGMDSTVSWGLAAPPVSIASVGALPVPLRSAASAAPSGPGGSRVCEAAVLATMPGRSRGLRLRFWQEPGLPLLCTSSPSSEDKRSADEASEGLTCAAWEPRRGENAGRRDRPSSRTGMALPRSVSHDCGARSTLPVQVCDKVGRCPRHTSCRQILHAATGLPMHRAHLLLGLVGRAMSLTRSLWAWRAYAGGPDAPAPVARATSAWWRGARAVRSARRRSIS